MEVSNDGRGAMQCSSNDQLLGDHSLSSSPRTVVSNQMGFCLC